MKSNRISTKAERDAVARKLESSTKGFRGASDRFARESQKRVDDFCKKIG